MCELQMSPRLAFLPGFLLMMLCSTSILALESGDPAPPFVLTTVCSNELWTMTCSMW